MKHSRIILLSTLMLLMHCGSMFAADNFNVINKELEQCAARIKYYEEQISYPQSKIDGYQHKIDLYKKNTSIFGLSGLCLLGLGIVITQSPACIALGSGALLEYFLLSKKISELKKEATIDGQVMAYYENECNKVHREQHALRQQAN